ncbi:hypothetical protein KAI32_02770 [Candidatus Pacearchaeota archaeon]|nr:hypothetical protein [Candidatus Pacearchaeota archaeon]
MEVMNKKGSEMTIGTIIFIVLGITILVFLIFGFSTGWNNLWDRVTLYGGSSNVDTVVKACALDCSVGNKYRFCNETRNLNNGTETITNKACKDLISYGVDKCGTLCD